MASNTVSRKIALGVAAAALLAPVAAAADDSFFAGKTIAIIAGFRPGGGVDGTARLVARHFGKFVPGKPTVLVKNIAGAAGGVAANHLYNKVDPDGLTLAMPGRTWMLSKLFNEPGARFEPMKFTYIGSPGPVNNKFWIRADLGIRTIEDLKKSKRKVVMGALNLRSTNGSVPTIMAHDGMPISVLPGYKGTSNIMLAIEQKEVDGMCSSDETFRANRGDLIDNKVVIPLLQSFPEEKGVPLFDTIISPKSKALFDLATASERFGLPLIGPPGVPADRVATLRKAFLAMDRDKDFAADTAKLGSKAGDAIEGGKLEQLIGQTLKNATPAVVKQFFEYTDSGAGKNGKSKSKSKG